MKNDNYKNPLLGCVMLLAAWLLILTVAATKAHCQVITQETNLITVTWPSGFQIIIPIESEPIEEGIVDIIVDSDTHRVYILPREHKTVNYSCPPDFQDVYYVTINDTMYQISSDTAFTFNVTGGPEPPPDETQWIKGIMINGELKQRVYGNFANVTWDGWIDVKESRNYTFYLEQAAGGQIKMWVDSVQVMEGTSDFNGGTFPMEEGFRHYRIERVGGVGFCHILVSVPGGMKPINEVFECWAKIGFVEPDEPDPPPIEPPEETHEDSVKVSWNRVTTDIFGGPCWVDWYEVYVFHEQYLKRVIQTTNLQCNVFLDQQGTWYFHVGAVIDNPDPHPDTKSAPSETVSWLVE